ncbi:hypothetical protein, partial [Gilvimarinus sp. 1_MG-2023]|uniref:hypothetical protein n=1 Tax=Gilvimarinus sp. 1_MG-2023 TaxID=3062638 RepID=UPI0026E47F31
KGIHSRGYLPHIDSAEFQVITYRLNDALPKAVIDRLRDLPDTQRRQHTEQAMDAGYGHCWLSPRLLHWWWRIGSTFMGRAIS